MAQPRPGPTLDAGELFRAHAAFVASFLARLGVPRADLDDLVQEVFMVAHRRGGFVPDRAKPTTWLAKIALGVAANQRRARARRRPADAEDLLGSLPSGERSPEEAAQTAQALSRALAALEALDLEHRAVFVLYEIEGESCADIAEGLGIPKGTVHSRLHKARKKFEKAHRRLMLRERGAAAEVTS